MGAGDEGREFRFSDGGRYVRLCPRPVQFATFTRTRPAPMTESADYRRGGRGKEDHKGTRRVLNNVGAWQVASS